jgi:hypothetical protein
VRIAHRILKITLGGVAITLGGTIFLVFDVVVGHPAGLIAGIVALVVIAATWLLLPIAARKAHVAD